MPSLTHERVDQLSNDGRTVIIRNQRVYDITKFSKSHPGGEKIIQFYHGKDVTKVMESGVHSHSRNAYRWLEQYYIGDYKSKSSIQNGVETNSRLHNHESTLNNSSTEDFANKPVDPINWNEPVLWQVGSMGARYHDWVDNPVDKPLRLFKSDFVEFFSSTPWYIIPMVWLPIVAMFIYRSYCAFLSNEVYVFSIAPVPLVSMPFLFITGAFGWTFTEYALHRWLFHRDPPTTSYFLITLHFLLHGQHHKVPFDSGRLVFPPVPASILGIILYTVFRIFFVAAITDIFAAGLVFGYICYDLTHYYLHYGSPSKGSYFDRLRSYHVRHHFESPHLGFGISSKLWDYPFNTLIKSSKRG